MSLPPSIFTGAIGSVRRDSTRHFSLPSARLIAMIWLALTVESVGR